MSIQFSCGCGKAFNVADEKAGMRAKCPQCGSVMTVPAASAVAAPVPAAVPPVPAQTLNYAGGGYVAPGGPIAPPPSSFVRTPTAVSDKLRSPGLPPVFLVLSTQGANVNAAFDVSPAMDALVEGFAKKLKKQFDVQIVTAPPAGAPYATVRLVNVDEGNRFLRYFLTLFAGKTVFEVEGQVQSISGQQVPFYEKQKGMGGFFGGAAINLLQMSAKQVGTRIAKKLLK